MAWARHIRTCTEDSTARNWLTKERVCILFSENKIDEEDEKWTIPDKNSCGGREIWTFKSLFFTTYKYWKLIFLINNKYLDFFVQYMYLQKFNWNNTVRFVIPNVFLVYMQYEYAIKKRVLPEVEEYILYCSSFGLFSLNVEVLPWVGPTEGFHAQPPNVPTE